MLKQMEQQSSYQPQPPLGLSVAIRDRLATLRDYLQREGVDLCSGDVPPMVFLSDICQQLGLSAFDRRVVLGRAGEAFVEALADSPVALVETERAPGDAGARKPRRAN